MHLCVIIKGEAVVSNCRQQTTTSFQSKQAGLKLRVCLSHITALYTHSHKLSLHVFVAFFQINNNHWATVAESDDRLAD